LFFALKRKKQTYRKEMAQHDYATAPIAERVNGPFVIAMNGKPESIGAEIKCGGKNGCGHAAMQTMRITYISGADVDVSSEEWNISGKFDVKGLTCPGCKNLFYVRPPAIPVTFRIVK